MSRYTNIKATASKLIDKYGMDAVISREGGQDYKVRVVQSVYTPRDIDGKTILQNDRRFLLSAKGITFVPNKEVDRLIVDTTKYPSFIPGSFELVNSTPTSPGGDDVIYELQVRA